MHITLKSTLQLQIVPSVDLLPLATDILQHLSKQLPGSTVDINDHY